MQVASRPSPLDLSPRAWAELACLALIWGGSFLAVRVALDEIGFLTSVLYRVGLACVVLWGVVLWRGLGVPSSARVWFAFLVMGCLNNVIPFSLMAWGQLHIASGLTSIFNASTAIFTVFAAAVLLPDERLTARRAAGIAVGFAGVCVAIGLENLRHFDLQSLAQLAVVGGAISYALAAVWARRRLAGLRPEVAAAGMLTGSSLVMLFLAPLVEGAPQLDLQPRTWIAIAYYALVATALAYLLYYRVLAMAGSGNLSLVTLLVVPVAITLGAAVRDESLSFNAYAGFFLLAVGLAVLDGRIWRQIRAWLAR